MNLEQKHEDQHRCITWMPEQGFFLSFGYTKFSKEIDIIINNLESNKLRLQKYSI